MGSSSSKKDCVSTCRGLGKSGTIEGEHVSTAADHGGFPMSIVILLAGVIVVLGVLILMFEVRKKHVSAWIGGYWRHQLRPKHVPLPGECTQILFCMVDHFEPISAGSTKEQERKRMRDWLERYPALAHRHKDSDGRPPQHTWFYPAENYDPEYLDDLARLCRQGLGEIEL